MSYQWSLNVLYSCFCIFEVSWRNRVAKTVRNFWSECRIAFGFYLLNQLLWKIERVQVKNLTPSSPTVISIRILELSRRIKTPRSEFQANVCKKWRWCDVLQIRLFRFINKKYSNSIRREVAISSLYRCSFSHRTRCVSFSRCSAHFYSILLSSTLFLIETLKSIIFPLSSASAAICIGRIFKSHLIWLFEKG